MKILILFGHPAFQNSRINKGMVKGINQIDNVTFHDLYEAYPELDIDIDYEQKLVENHDCIVFHHPMYWYSAPAIFKEWQDLVLEHDWAYGSKGNALKGKLFFTTLTTGAAKRSFCRQEFQTYTVREFLAPFFQMSNLCGMTALAPFVIHGSHIVTPERIEAARSQYHCMLRKIANNEIDIPKAVNAQYLNDLIEEEHHA